MRYSVWARGNRSGSCQIYHTVSAFRTLDAKEKLTWSSVTKVDSMFVLYQLLHLFGSSSESDLASIGTLWRGGGPATPICTQISPHHDDAVVAVAVFSFREVSSTIARAPSVTLLLLHRSLASAVDIQIFELHSCACSTTAALLSGVS
jgi:hypothetical protein